MNQTEKSLQNVQKLGTLTLIRQDDNQYLVLTVSHSSSSDQDHLIKNRSRAGSKLLLVSLSPRFLTEIAIFVQTVDWLTDHEKRVPDEN